MRSVSDSRHLPRSTPSPETRDDRAGRLLAALRAEFPGWGIVYDSFADVWVALRGKDQTLVAADPAELRARLTHTAGVEPPQ